MNYKDLPVNSRVWIYQSNREFNAQEIEEIKARGEEFLLSWSAHGAALRACMEIFYNRFIVIFADEQQASASGCSIDKSVNFIKQVENNFAVSLLDRTLVAYRLEEKIHTVPLSELKKTFSLSEGEGWGEALIFNNLVSTKKEFETRWEIPLKESWIKQGL